MIIRTFLIATILMILLGCSNLTNITTAKNQTDTINQMDEGIALIRKGESDKGHKLLMEYLQKHPEDEEWLNIWLGYYFFQKRDFEQAEKYYIRTIWSEHGEIDGLRMMEYIMPYTKLMTRKQIQNLVAESWCRIKTRLWASPSAGIFYYQRLRPNYKSIYFMTEEEKLGVNPIEEPFIKSSPDESSKIPDAEFKYCKHDWRLFLDAQKSKSAKYFTMAAYEHEFWAWLSSFNWERQLVLPEKEEEIIEFSTLRDFWNCGSLGNFADKHWGSYSVNPIFVSLADFYNDSAKSKYDQLKQLKSEDTEKMVSVVNSAIADYKFAIYFYHRSYYLLIINLDYGYEPILYPLQKEDEEWFKQIQYKIGQVRQKISELETQLNQQKDSPSPAK